MSGHEADQIPKSLMGVYNRHSSSHYIKKEGCVKAMEMSYHGTEVNVYRPTASLLKVGSL